MKLLLPALPERLRARTYEIVLFVIVGLLNTAVDFAVLNLLIILTHHDSGLWLIAFTCLGFLSAAVNSYVLNGRLTFRGQASDTSFLFLRFIVVNAVGLVINSCVVWLMVLLLGHSFPVIIEINFSKVLAVLCSLSWNYFAMKRWVFNKRPGQPGHSPSSLQEGPVAQLAMEDGRKAHTHTILPGHKKRLNANRVTLVRETMYDGTETSIK